MKSSCEVQRKVAIIGGGPGGLVAARYLQSQGFAPTIFEQSGSVGGQWNARAAHSGVWSGMPTNTSRVMTRFSDLEHEAGTPVYPGEKQMLEYLQRYAARFELLPCVRLNTRVELIEHDSAGEGWLVHSARLNEDGQAEDDTQMESFSHVVVASGRYSKPRFPAVPGLDSFSGEGGVIHTFDFKEVERYRNLRVLVAGCSISALEIASALAMQGSPRVVSTMRRQRYVLPKLITGVPTEHKAFTRFAALAAETFPLEAVGAGLREFVLQSGGNPEQFGALRPAENIFEAGVTQCQHFLPLVAEGRIVTKPWIEKVEGQTVIFSDGTSEEVDAIIFGTGYSLNLPFLSEEIRQTLNLDACHSDLYNSTFHPDLPGLAFLGLFELVGPYFPILELQARWISYLWNGVLPMPSAEEMRTGIAAYQARRGQPQEQPMHALALLFARAAGVEPEIEQWPEQTRALLFGPLSPSSFRLSGPDSLPDAAQRFEAEAKAFGAIPSPELTPEQSAQWEALSAARQSSTAGS